MSFETADDPSVKWLDKGSHIWCEKLQSDASWTVFNVVTTEIVDKQNNLPILQVHLDVKFPDVPSGEISSNHTIQIESHLSKNSDVIHAILL